MIAEAAEALYATEAEGHPIDGETMGMRGALGRLIESARLDANHPNPEIAAEACMWFLSNEARPPCEIGYVAFVWTVETLRACDDSMPSVEAVRTWALTKQAERKRRRP